MNSQTVFSFKIFQTNIALIRPMVVVHLKVLLHVAHVQCNLTTQKTLDTFVFRYLTAVLTNILIEIYLTLANVPCLFPLVPSVLLLIEALLVMVVLVVSLLCFKVTAVLHNLVTRGHFWFTVHIHYRSLSLYLGRSILEHIGVTSPVARHGLLIICPKCRFLLFVIAWYFFVHWSVNIGIQLLFVIPLCQTFYLEIPH